MHSIGQMDRHVSSLRPVPRAMSNRNHICDICSQAFIRAEHLSRHRRIRTSHDLKEGRFYPVVHNLLDTREKPYKCDHCSDCFSRTDLRSRHISLAHRDEVPGREQQCVQLDSASAFAQENPRKRPRTKIACNYCNLHKLKCSVGRPCDRCRAKNLPCISPQLQSSQHDGLKANTLALHNNLETEGGALHAIERSSSDQAVAFPTSLSHMPQLQRFGEPVPNLGQLILTPADSSWSDGPLFSEVVDSETDNSLLENIGPVS